MIFLILSLPLIGFEMRHGYSQTKSLVVSLTQGQADIVSGVDKFERVLFLASKNVTNLYLGQYLPINYTFSFALGIFLLYLLFIYKKLNREIIIFFATWVTIFILFFSFNSKVLSEYYLNGMLLVWVVALFYTISVLVQSQKWWKFGLVVLVVYIFLNGYRFITYPVNASGYIQRKAIVSRIRADALEHNYPCISISYITSPGADLGYRYFFYLEKMHVNHPAGGSPVYTIVFPQNLVDRFDKSFGALGLILPDYERYTQDEVLQSCLGQNSNEIDLPFGYTE